MKPGSAKLMYLVMACCLILPEFSSQQPLTTADNKTEAPIRNDKHTELTHRIEQPISHSRTRDPSLYSRGMESTDKTPNSTKNNQRPEKYCEEEQNCRGDKYQDAFIKTDLDFLFRMNKTDAWKCLKNQIASALERALRHRNRNDTDQSCLNLTMDESLELEYVQTDDDAVLWYPFIHCKNKNESVQMYFEECKRTVAARSSSQNDRGVAFMPSLPWKCQFQNDTRNYSTIFTYLNISRNPSLLEDCGELLCESKYSHRSNITILHLNVSTNSACGKTLERIGSHVCYPEKNPFCFFVLKIFRIQRSIVFIINDNQTITNDNQTITNDNQTLSETQKLVVILRSLVNQTDKHWCERPLNYTTKSRIINNVSQTFFYCHGAAINTTTADAWITADPTDKDSLVSLHSQINHAVIPSNQMLQALISTNTMINTTAYNEFATSGIEFKRDTSQFNIHIFEGSQSEAGVLQHINKGNLSVKRNQYFTKLTDKRSMWSQLNWIIFHNCSINNGDKDLFLFLSDNTDFESICNNQTDVLLTTIRREKVVSLNITSFLRDCTDGALHENISEHCKSLIKDGSDYETRFFQFLVHQLPLSQSHIDEFDQQFINENKTLTANFAFNTNPDFLGRVSYLNETFSSEIPEDDRNLQQESLRLTLQILVIASLTNNTDCLNDIKNGRFSFEIKKHEHLNKVYEIGPIATGVSNAACLKILPLSILQDLKTVRLNKFWPLCMYDKFIAWNEVANSVSEWDYLSSDCQRGEIALFIVCCIITITTITGNILVITIIISTELIQKQAFMLYTSLALSDLLLGVASALPAVLDTYSLMKGQLTIYDLTKLGPLENFLRPLQEQLKGFQDVMFQRKDFSALPGITLNISIMTSLMTLALLGIDRLLMLKRRYLKSNHIKAGIITMWTWNIICAVLISYGENDTNELISFTSYFDPLTKLTLNIGKDSNCLSGVVFKIQLFIGGMAGLIIVIASTASIVIFNFKAIQQDIMIHDQRRGEKIQVVTRTFLMMVILFLVSCVPMAYSIISKSLFPKKRTTDVPYGPLFHCITWWLCVAGSSWNWIIYCFRGTYFQSEARKLWHKFF